MFKAEIIADSINEAGERLTSMVIVCPRIVLAEFNTHRVFSRNSSSSRAIPFEKMVQMVEEHPFIPIKWMKEHKGMQGTEYFIDEVRINTLRYDWLEARDLAVQQAKKLNKEGLTKQLCNRLLEPYMWHTVLVTSTEWENFFALRNHPDAEIHIQKIAEIMLRAYNNSTPKLLQLGEWHIPFGDKIDELRLLDNIVNPTGVLGNNLDEQDIQINLCKIKIATARCARVSYLNFEGKDDYFADIKLHDNLLSAGHMSPFEHCAMCYPGGQSGNFKGFRQYRKMIPGESKTDNRVKKYADNRN